MQRGLWLMLVAGAAACSPTAPKPPDVGPATPPVVRSITVPAARVETGQDVTISTVVEDAETPLTQLTFIWSANAGMITGSGASVTWRHEPGIKAGVNVVITLTVVDKYQAVENNVIVEREFRVVSQAAPFRVHDSSAEMKELARHFLVDLFGNSSIPPEECLVDFSETCAKVGNGKDDERRDIIDHRTQVVVQQATIFTQAVTFPTSSTALVISDSLFIDKWLDDGRVEPYRNDFYVTGIYEMGRWWICQSFVPDQGTGTSRADALYRNKRVGRVRAPVK